MNNNQENFLKELAQLFEKYSIIRAYMTDEGFENNYELNEYMKEED